MHRSLLFSLALTVGTAAADEALRWRKDAAREREWMLTARGVLVRDHKARTTTLVALPEWVLAQESYVCAPDLALGPRGEAVVSSNVVAALWRIDPVTLQVTKHDLVVDAPPGKDVAFTGLAYSARSGVYYAVSPFGALWRIDPMLRRAQAIALNEPAAPACGLSELSRMRLCVHGPGRDWVVNLAPDQRAAYVWPFASCASQPASSSSSLSSAAENAFTAPGAS